MKQYFFAIQTRLSYNGIEQFGHGTSNICAFLKTLTLSPTYNKEIGDFWWVWTIGFLYLRFSIERQTV